MSSEGTDCITIETVELPDARARELRLRMFLEILAASCGQADASDYRWNWINAFCGEHEGCEPDTFNTAHDAGYTTVSHDSDTDSGIVRLTDAGRAYLATPPASDAAVPAGEVDDPDHQYAVVSSNYVHPFLAGAYPTLEAAERAQCGRPDLWHIYHRLAAAPKVASDTGAGLRALDLFMRAAYPVATEINPRGYNWSEAYLDQARQNALTTPTYATDGATGLVADLRNAIDGLNGSGGDSEKIDGILTALLKRIFHNGSAAGRLSGRLDVERACEMAAQVAEREQRYEGSDFPVGRGIAAEIRLIPAKMWAEG